MEKRAKRTGALVRTAVGLTAPGITAVANTEYHFPDAPTITLTNSTPYPMEVAVMIVGRISVIAAGGEDFFHRLWISGNGGAPTLVLNDPVSFGGAAGRQTITSYRPYEFPLTIPPNSSLTLTTHQSVIATLNGAIFAQEYTSTLAIANN